MFRLFGVCLCVFVYVCCMRETDRQTDRKTVRERESVCSFVSVSCFATVFLLIFEGYNFIDFCIATFLMNMLGWFTFSPQLKNKSSFSFIFSCFRKVWICLFCSKYLSYLGFFQGCWMDLCFMFCIILGTIMAIVFSTTDYIHYTIYAWKMQAF